METITIRNVTFFYPEQQTPALDRLDLTVEEGEFLVLCGPSGCGKSTLLRQLKPALAPHGARTGEILFEGRPLEEWDHRTQSARIGFVQQSPDNQIVTDKVWHELAFGLESLGCDTPTIRRRVAEMASFFGIQTWFHRAVTELSGGQKQLLNLAGVMTMGPSLLILDEPTSQLDPIAASDFLSVLGKINRELGVTILLTEHRLEDALPLASRAAVMDRGRLLFAGPPGQIGPRLRDSGHPMFLAMPAPMRVWAAVETNAPCPVTVREGRAWLENFAESHPLDPLPEEPPRPRPQETAITASELWFRYEKDLPDVVKGLSMTVGKGEFLALLGGNGTGKTTTLRLIAGLRKPHRGDLHVNGSVAVLPQNPQALFVKKTVREDLWEVLSDSSCPRSQQEDMVSRVIRLCRLEDVIHRHPYDLSGGEQQRAALAKVLLLEPDILLLDEPTKGLDAAFKQVLADLLGELLRRGVTVLMVSHDVEFCARHAHRCALFFDGAIVTDAPPRAFFSGNQFYTTAANRMARSRLPQAVTAEDVIAACGGAPPPQPEPPPRDAPAPQRLESPWRPAPLPRWRKLLAGVSAAAALAAFLSILRVTDLSGVIASGGMTPLAGEQLRPYALLVGALLALILALGRRSPPPARVRVPGAGTRLPKRTAISAGLILLAIPVTLFAGHFYLADRKYYFIALLILLECMLPFFLLFEGRRPQARELTVLASLCAVGVAGRAALFMLPQFKPVTAITILTGIAFGGEAGFLVGSMTMLVSNILFSQGPWTPWQMFCMGLIGFLAGVLFQKGLLRRDRASMAVFGALAAVLLYGGIMNPASALMWSHEINGKILLTYYLSGFPMDCIHGAATFIFLWFGGEPMLEKLDRIKLKYGLMETPAEQR